MTYALRRTLDSVGVTDPADRDAILDAVGRGEMGEVRGLLEALDLSAYVIGVTVERLRPYALVARARGAVERAADRSRRYDDVTPVVDLLREAVLELAKAVEKLADAAP